MNNSRPFSVIAVSSSSREDTASASSCVRALTKNGSVIYSHLFRHRSLVSGGPPGLQEGDRVFVFEGAVLALVLQEHRERLAYGGAAGDAEEFHDVLAVEVGTFLRPLFLHRQISYAHFQFVDALVECRDFAGVAGGAVAADELVQVAEQMAGIAGVAANGRVFPAVLVAVETSTEGNQLADVRDHRRFHAEGGQACRRHASAYDLMVVEGDLAVLDPTGRRLADIVEQRGHAESQAGRRLRRNGDAVGQHVLVTVDRVLLHGERWDFGNGPVEKAVFQGDHQAFSGVVDRENLAKAGQIRCSGIGDVAGETADMARRE